MAEQFSMHQLSLNDMPIHKFIPMEKLDLIHPNEVRILSYQNPSRFYVYLRQKINSHAQFQIELQRAMGNYQSTTSISQYQRYQSVAAQDHHTIWHRATILDVHPNSTEVRVYFVDVGEEENISLTNIRPLSPEFNRQPAFAIPCRLFGIFPLNSTSWKFDDPVHDRFNRLMANNASCKVCDIKEQICYDVAIEIPNVGDLGTYLFQQNLVSHNSMRTAVQNTYQSSARVPPGFPDIQPSLPTRAIQKPIVPLSQNSPTSTESSSEIPTLVPQDGNYIITQVYSATEFHGHSQIREKELDAFHKHLEMIYNNNNTNDQSLSVHFLMEGVPCVIQQGEKYHRVVIKHRESETRVSVKLVDRGDEIIVDTSELLQLDKKYFSIPAFAQSFRLHNYDETHSTANITRKLKRLILNQRVHITPHHPMINGFYPVEMKLSDNQSVNQILLSNDPLPINPTPTPPPPPVRPVEAPATKPLRVADDLPPPQKLLTAPTTTTTTGRFSRPQEQREEPTPVVSGNQPSMSDQNRPYGRGFSTDRTGSYNRGGRNNEENGGQRTEGFNGNRGGGFADRGTRNGFGGDRNFENNGQRSRGFNNNRGARNGDFSDRNDRFRNNQDDENGPQRFPSRGGFNGERRDRNGAGFQRSYDREDGGNQPRRGGFDSSRGRGGFSDRGRGGFGARSNNFGDRSEDAFRSVPDTNEPMKTFSGWPNVKPTTTPFESSDQYLANEIPQSTFQFVISHIEKCNDFFIQLFSKEHELSALSETLQKEYKDAPELLYNSMKVNQACLAKSSDNCWYRAIILTAGLTKSKVRFIDFGDTIELDNRTIRQLAKKFSLAPPYAYRCTLKNVQSNDNVQTEEIISKCAERKFHGKIEKKTAEERYLLQSEDLEQLMIDIKAISKNLPCTIVYIDSEKHQFYIQDDSQTMEKINEEVHTEMDLPSEEIQVNAMVISTFDEAPFRAIIQSDLDENVSVYFIDYGNTNITSKSSLKKCPEQLKAYPPQAKRCQLSNTSFNDLDQAFKQLDDYLESDQVAYSIVNQTDDLFHVLLYINGECFQEKSANDTNADSDDQSSTTTATTVKEQERPNSASGKRNNEAILSPADNSSSVSMNSKRQKSESEMGDNSIKYHQGILTHLDPNKPLVYVQLLPESDEILKQLDELIDALVQENQHPSSIEIGDYVVAQFTDGNHYRARIESFNESYTVYFLDYGNTETNVLKHHLYSYSDQLKEIPALAHAYSIEKITSQRWMNHIRSLLEEKLNETIEFHLIDSIKSIIHLKFDNENQIYNQPKTFTANISATNKDCFYIHILPDTDAKICEMDELLPAHAKEHNQSNEWKINDLCIVFDSDQERHFRGKILSIENEKYQVQCIDYGNILSNISNENLYLLTEDELIKQDPLARQCRLHGVDEKDQVKAINEIIRNINPSETVTITVDNDQNDQCMFVMLFRENHEIVNDRFIQQETELDGKRTMSSNSSDSAITADDDPLNDQPGPSPIGTPQAESTHQYADTATTSIDQTIDFGENDPSTSNATIRDETINDK